MLSEGSKVPGASVALHEPPDRVSINGAPPVPAVDSYLPTASQLEVDGQAIPSRNPPEPPEDVALAGSGTSTGVTDAAGDGLDDRHGVARCVLVGAGGVQVPAARTGDAHDEGRVGTEASAGRGASVAVHVPPERERRTPF